jgi:LemA protein
MGSIIVLVLLAVLVVGGISIYNRLVSLRNQYRNAFGQIDVQLRRRHDLIPNLVETARAYMAHERETLEGVITARNVASRAESRAAAAPGSAAAMSELLGAEQALGGALTRFFALAEAYPDLKANQNMLQLNEELASTENRIAFARQAFNDSVMHFNNAREVFPANVVAGAFGFEEAPLFLIEDESQREAPRVSFG